MAVRGERLVIVVGRSHLPQAWCARLDLRSIPGNPSITIPWPFFFVRTAVPLPLLAGVTKLVDPAGLY